jgi:hypothetical protein
MSQVPQSVQTFLRAGRPSFDCQHGQKIFLLATASKLALGPTQTPFQWVPGALSLGKRRMGSEADHSPPSGADVKNEWTYEAGHSPPSSAAVKNEWSYSTTPPCVCMAWYLMSTSHRLCIFYFRFGLISMW